MSEQIDWSKAPEGATHANGAGVFLRENKSGSVSNFDNGKWIMTSSTIADFNHGYIFERPTTQSWSGEGLPPVGVVCEVDWCEEWHKCEVIAHFQQRCGMVAAFTVEISDGAKSLDAFGAGSFRPIRTPEQIESDARIKAAQEWLKSIELEYGEDVADQCENILMAAEEKRMDKL